MVKSEGLFCWARKEPNTFINYSAIPLSDNRIHYDFACGLKVPPPYHYTTTPKSLTVIDKVFSIHDDDRDIQFNFKDVQEGRVYLRQEINRFEYF